MSSPKIEKHTVLIIDKSDNILELIETILEDEDIEVVTRNSFEKGLEYIKSVESTSLVIADYCEEQDRNGLQFLNQISTLSPKTIRVLNTCCLKDSELEYQRKEGNIHSHFKAPFQINEILDKVKLGLKQYEKNISTKNPCRCEVKKIQFISSLTP